MKGPLGGFTVLGTVVLNLPQLGDIQIALNGAENCLQIRRLLVQVGVGHRAQPLVQRNWGWSRGIMRSTEKTMREISGGKQKMQKLCGCFEKNLGENSTQPKNQKYMPLFGVRRKDQLLFISKSIC